MVAEEVTGDAHRYFGNSRAAGSRLRPACFIVGDDDLVYEKDLGSDTTNLAQAMTTIPGPGWHRVEYK
jgi:hypothetical protein